MSSIVKLNEIITAAQTLLTMAHDCEHIAVSDRIGLASLIQHAQRKVKSLERAALTPDQIKLARFEAKAAKQAAAELAIAIASVQDEEDDEPTEIAA